MSNKRNPIHYLAVCAMFTAVAYVAVLVCKPIPGVAGFLSYEAKDAVIVIAGFILGPLSCVAISVLTSLIEMLTISDTHLIGFLMNVLSTCAFTVPAVLLYKRLHTQKGAVIGLCVGVLAMSVTMVAWNYLITPLYMNVDRSVVTGMLLKVFLPFNLVKGGLNAGLTLLLYKPIVTALRKAGLVPASSGRKGRFSPGFLLFSLVILATFVLLLLVLLGVI